MDGIHDLGGKQGFGKIDRRGADRVFQARWEAAVFAMTRAAGAAGAMVSTDRFRHAIERIDPRAYLDHGYYGRWLGGVETLLIEAGLVTREAIDKRAQEMGAAADDLVAARPKPEPDPVGPLPSRADSIRPIADREPAFAVGQRVRTVSHGASGHTRLPAYARGRPGTVIAFHDGWVFPDTNAHGQGESPKFLYTVSFTSEALWERAGFSVSLDLFEPYLEAINE